MMSTDRQVLVLHACSCFFYITFSPQVSDQRLERPLFLSFQTERALTNYKHLLQAFDTERVSICGVFTNNMSMSEVLSNMHFCSLTSTRLCTFDFLFLALLYLKKLRKVEIIVIGKYF